VGVQLVTAQWAALLMLLFGAACASSSSVDPPKAAPNVRASQSVVPPETADSTPAQATPAPPCAGLDELWDHDHPELSAVRFREAAAGFASSGDTGCELEALGQLARAEGLQRKFDDAHRVLDDVDRRLAGMPVGRAALRSKLERGRVLNSSKQPDRATPLFVEAWELARRLGEDGLAVDAAHMVAIARMSVPDEALAWNHRAIELAETSASEAARRWMGSLYNNTGWVHFERGEYERALELFQKGVGVREQQGKLVPLLIARWTVGRTLRALGRTEEALLLQENLRASFEANGEPPDGFVYEELAECTLALGKPGHAALFRRAHEILSEDAAFREAEPERLERLRRLGER
jgi:tetratricopeptide (TPR) repeat protein